MVWHSDEEHEFDKEMCFPLHLPPFMGLRFFLSLCLHLFSSSHCPFTHILSLLPQPFLITPSLQSSLAFTTISIVFSACQNSSFPSHMSPFLLSSPLSNPFPFNPSIHLLPLQSRGSLGVLWFSHQYPLTNRYIIVIDSVGSQSV